MPSLILSNNSASNPQTLDLSNYLRLQPDQGTDPADAAFSEKIWGRSILREGATLALEQVVEKELLFPLALKGTTASVVSGTLVQQINQIITTAGATVSWQDDGMSQPTVFDLLSGQVDIEYSYFRGKQAWCNCKMRLFTQPYGRTASPRLYATASGVGPLLVISPYASGGGQVIGASTQAGVAGFGGVKQGGVPSGGVFYWGSPSLAGDAPAMLQVSYVGPLPNASSDTGAIPYTLVSLLPDALYRPLITAPEMTVTQIPVTAGVSTARISQQTAVASSYLQLWNQTYIGPAGVRWSFTPLAVPSYSLQEPSVAWGGQHRLLAISRASGLGGSQPPTLIQATGGPKTNGASVAVPLSVDWGLYDLGTFSISPSEPVPPVTVNGYAGASQALDVAALIMLPDSATWLLSPLSVAPSQYGAASSIVAHSPPPWPPAPYTNSVLVDDVLGGQFIYSGASQTAAASPSGSVPSAAAITQFTRGLVPRPDPKNGLPIIAILGLAQSYVLQPKYVAFNGGDVAGVSASWANPQNLRTLAQVNVLERTRFELT